MAFKKVEKKVAPKKSAKKILLEDNEGEILLGKRKLIDSKKEKEIIKE